jgi:hypothetical protein
MVINPGKSTFLFLTFNMHGEMGGPHEFRIHVPNNDPKQPDATLTVLSNWVE